MGAEKRGRKNGKTLKENDKKMSVLILTSSGGFTIKPNEQNEGACNVKDYRDSFRRISLFLSVGFYFYKSMSTTPP